MRRPLALLTRIQIENALRRLGELALQHGESIELLAVGGAVMPFITPGHQLKARYAFLDLWESIHDND